MTIEWQDQDFRLSEVLSTAIFGSPPLFLLPLIIIVTTLHHGPTSIDRTRLRAQGHSVRMPRLDREADNVSSVIQADLEAYGCVLTAHGFTTRMMKRNDVSRLLMDTGLSSPTARRSHGSA